MLQEQDLETLLDLNEIIIEQIEGYWTKFEAKKVNKTNERPYGIRYSLTLHDKYGNRIMGFDNAHPIKQNSVKLNKQYDHYHRHIEDKGIPYEFINAHKLLEDFWKAVDKKLNEIGSTIIKRWL